MKCDHEILGIHKAVEAVRHFDGPTITCKTCGQELMNSGEVDKNKGAESACRIRYMQAEFKFSAE
jgi:hypothetical protein